MLFRMGKRPDGTRGKRPAAPSVRRPRRKTVGPDIKAQIVDELYILLERLDADEELLSIIGGWHDIFDDADVLALLREYRQGRIIPRRH
jgi:hypothetical protein